jgi:hypothetical protein
MHDGDEAVLLVDDTRTTTGLVPLSTVWQVAPMHRDLIPMSALAIDVTGLTVVSPNTDLADAVGSSATGAILVSEPDRVVGVILPSDVSSIECSRRPAAGAPT